MWYFDVCIVVVVVVVARLFFIVAAHVGQMLSVRERLISPINIYTGRCVRCACAEWVVGGWPPPSLFVCVSRNPGREGGWKRNVCQWHSPRKIGEIQVDGHINFSSSSRRPGILLFVWSGGTKTDTFYFSNSGTTKTKSTLGYVASFSLSDGVAYFSVGPAIGCKSWIFSCPSLLWIVCVFVYTAGRMSFAYRTWPDREWCRAESLAAATAVDFPFQQQQQTRERRTETFSSPAKHQSL
jgi:hypothetical protein